MQQVVLVARETRVDPFELVEEFLVTAGLAGLALQRNDLAFDFLDDVGDADEVGLGVLELAEGFLLLVLVLVDARGFFKNRAAILGMRAEDLVDLPLRHQ